MDRHYNKLTVITGILLSFIINTSVFAQQNIPAAVLNYADTILYNGQVITADNNFSIAEAVAIRDGKFLAVGSTDEILPLAGPNTRRIDLRGRSATPGFIYSDGDNAIPGGDLVKDSQWGGTMQQQIGGPSMEQLEQTFIHIIENEALPGEMVFLKVVDQWSGPIMDTWTKSQLDEIAPENPTILLPGCCYAIVNTAMLNLMLDKGFPEDHFHLMKDARGQPTGQLGSNAVGFIGRELRPFPPPEWISEYGIKGAIETIGEYAAEGITTASGHMTGLTVLILNRIFKQGDLAIRIHPALDMMRQNTFPERTLARVGNIMDFALVDERGPMVQIVGTSVGPHAGAPDDATGMMTIEPKTRILPELGESPYGYDQWSAEYYTGKKSGDLTEEELRQTEYYNIQVARQYGYNVNGVHNMGSAGILLAMKAIVEAENQDVLYVPELSRAQAFDHNIDWTEEVYDYFKEHEDFLKDKLRVGISLKTAMNQRDALIYGYEDLLSLQYGWDGLERLAPLKSLLDAGIAFHIEGTDPRNPPMGIVKSAVTRIDRKGRVVAPNEALTREQAILAITRWAARFLSAEDEIGSIEAGKLADIVVFDGRVMDVPIEEIDTLKPLLTLVGGRVAFESDAL
jgi:predicted amidohydrolase YtcJ